ncbi:MAG: cupredoxin domain-containing protein [Myxococcota bacterium]
MRPFRFVCCLVFLAFAVTSFTACGDADTTADSTATDAVGSDDSTGSADDDASGSVTDPTENEGDCTANCTGKTCGDDGCGGSCGTCGSGDACNATGVCVATADCTDTCESVGATCGTMCGEACGTCSVNSDCVSGACVCAASCEGKTCGDDGCGGSCGTCAADETCDGSSCVGAETPPTPVCGDGTCNGTESCLTCTEDCGPCADETTYYCFELNACLVEGCDPNSANFQTCAQGNMGVCQEAAVTPKDWSDWFAWQQCLATCMGQTPTPEQQNQCLEYGCPAEVAECFSGGTYGDKTCAEIDTCMNQGCNMLPQDQQSGCIRDCMATGTEDAVSQQVAILFCASNACANETTAAGQQACLQAALQPDGACADPVSICMGGSEVCTPACDGKDCGDDGCGGSCGECADGVDCLEGLCTPVECDVDCEGKSCGDDGCGGSCGECADGETCDAGTCEADAPASVCDATFADCSEADFDAGDMTAMTETVDIAMVGMAPYAPKCVRLKAGQTVTIGATAGHPFEKVCAEDDVMDSQDGQTSDVEFTLTTPGYYNYKCQFHGSMVGNIQVVP